MEAVERHGIAVLPTWPFGNFGQVSAASDEVQQGRLADIGVPDERKLWSHLW